MSTPIQNPRVYEPGRDITAQASAAVTAKRFVAISGNRTAGGNLSVAHAVAAGRVFGVAATDAAAGQLVRVCRGGVVKVVAEAAIPANTAVQVGANGQAVTLGAGVAVGYCITAATLGGDAEIALY
ncbi:capsid cement protein [Mycobacterium szulgai]|uniref:DUF2190 domain-containing protein n=1 Tax=Mycobacterium szulgai TaxID=1787 RepID=A0A1X2DKY4_MYCSZ|nr:capsid cement protein [Mycobacterium szulgai]MCV7076982.1 DUF2190 family protein [Mycobacterium szulgai]ORW88798.1 hypothetical protein AWC27_13950 [Mycobacterium szulgai]